ncbi:hypothetical protein FM106_15225 [Brachybacterium faecium]|nr:hypothetical protein FM106_15225 [Brachybacterium faecium]
MPDLSVTPSCIRLILHQAESAVKTIFEKMCVSLVEIHKM